MAAQVFSVKDMFYLSALLLMCSVVKEGMMTHIYMYVSINKLTL